MKASFGVLLVFLLTACGSGGPPPPDWKSDSADLIERYRKHELLGENLLAEHYFQQALAATSGAGRVAETARLWLVHCAMHRASLIDDDCHEYAELALIDTTPADRAYYRFITLKWAGLDGTNLPKHYAALLHAEPAKINATLNDIMDPTARLLAAGLVTLGRQADDTTLSIAAETASSQGWRRPLLVYLKLLEKRAAERGDTVAQTRLAARIALVEKSFSSAK